MEDDYRRIYVGNLPEDINEELLYELFLQAGPLQEVSLPKKPDGKPKQFAFILFKHECSVIYAKELLCSTRIFGNELKIQPKIRDGIERVREQVEKLPDVNGLNVLRGLGSDRRSSFSDSPTNESEMSSWSQQGGARMPDFEHLLHLGQQLQQVIPSFHSVLSQPTYGSQQLNFPTMPDDRWRGGSFHPSQNRHHNRHLMPHPYRDERPQRFDRNDRQSSSRHHHFSSSGHHHRERKGRRH